MAESAQRRSWPRWLIGGVVLVVVLVVGGPFVYIHFIEGPAPAKLSLSTTAAPNTTSSGARAPLAGTWKIGTGSTAGYRVRETLFGQHNTAVGRTNSVTGTMTIAGTKVTSASFTVDMASVTSDRSERDGQFQGRIMDTADYPTATFVLTDPIELAPIPKDGTITSYAATGKLTLHGTSRTVTIPLTAKRVANMIDVQGIVTVTFADYHIDNPSGGPASVGNSGQLEFLLALRPS
jgi:polyisoprenoid-binding protein YceI